ncbi:MAG: hypothetical protein IJ169_06890 [Paludibacteraceae bacterium]|nr:hypothetical protein [Paludibacteraceae bacterium]
MKHIAFRFLSRMNMLLASLIAALGIGGCKQQKTVAPNNTTDDTNARPVVKAAEDDAPVCMYGVPNARFEVSGRVEDTNHKPLQTRVGIGTMKGEIQYIVETQADGTFRTEFSGFPVHIVYFTVMLPEGEYTFAKQLTYGEPVSTWDRGTASADTVLVVPARRKSEPEIKVKYGVPATRYTE